MILGVGLTGTGTGRLAKALKILGINGVHRITDLPTTHVNPDNLGVDAVTNFAGLLQSKFFSLETLKNRYPNGTFILTTREFDPWFDYCKKHFLALHANIKSKGPKVKSTPLQYTLFDGIVDEYAYQEYYDAHHIKVENVLGDTVLKLDMSTNCWDILCNRLGVLIPREDWPSGKAADC